MNATKTTGSTIVCPHCEGHGYVEGHTGDYERMCPICACSHVGDPDGLLLLPLNPDVADAIYDRACRCCSDLVRPDPEDGSCGCDGSGIKYVQDNLTGGWDETDCFCLDEKEVG